MKLGLGLGLPYSPSSFGIIKSENWDEVTAPTVPSGWVQNEVGSNLVTSAVNPFSSPNDIVYPSGNSGAMTLLWNNPSSLRVNSIISGYFQADATMTAQVNFWILGRYNGASGISTVINSSSNYVGYLVSKPSGTSFVGLDKFVSGSSSTIGGPVNLPSYSVGVYYQVVLALTGSTISVMLQRSTDGMWLNASGSFVSGMTSCISMTDTSVSAAGYSGMGFFAPSATDQAGRADNWQLKP